ncbi:MAG: 16S rRNA (adenine(1518)-N(6)/adenine(1519)-N(6))-dimethyltransferase RsmA [Promethearchaeota archaeon]|jgi:16S rRNA (adenine1518-N6/adenine1519-N6)-dimethyltransferase
MNYKDVQLTLKRLNLKPKKRLGQNFLTDKNIVNKIVTASEASKEDIILEIGPGLGALTEPLAEKAKKIFAIEIDPNLSKHLSEVFSIYNNIEIINGDILRVSLPKHNKVVSNLPFTITGPILEKVFFKKNPPSGILTIEKSIGKRFFLSGNYKEFSRISVTLNAFMKPIFKRNIPRSSFYPIPKIDLLLIKIVPNENLNPFLSDANSISFFLKFVAGIMPYKGKNIVNALSYYFKATEQTNYTKDKILQILGTSGYENKKLFNFKIEEIIGISKLFYS